MKFSEWMIIREFEANPLQSILGTGAAKPTIKKKDVTVDNVRSILMKEKDPKMAIKKVGQIYDNKMKSTTDPNEMAVAMHTKSGMLSTLSK